MIEKKIKLIRRVILFGFMLFAVLNLIWPINGFLWAYWLSRFLLDCELVILGISFIIFPKVMMRVWITNKADYDSIDAWRIVLSGLITGIPVFVVGVYFLSLVIKNWIAQCSNFLDCVK